MSRLPEDAAFRHVISFQGQSFSIAHCKAGRFPTDAAFSHTLDLGNDKLWSEKLRREIDLTASF